MSGMVLAIEGTDFAPTTGSPLLRPVRAFLRALAAALSRSGLGFPIHSVFCARDRAWAGHPAHTPRSCCLVRWELRESEVAAETWAENLNAVEKGTGSSPVKNLPVGSHPASASIGRSLAFGLDEPTIF